MEVTYINHMGEDLSVVNAARVSFGKKHSMYEEESDTKLIKYLAKHGHISPFGHSFASFHVKAPLFVARQLVKHKFLRWNEISRRYVDSDPEFYEPKVWRGKAEDKKQGSSGELYPSTDIDFASHTALRVYKELLEEGTCPEMARMVLPQSMMTEWYWSGSLDAFSDMYNLRSKSDTQWETQQVANQIGETMSDLYPVSWEALTNV